MLLIPVLGRQSQADLFFEASLFYKASSRTTSLLASKIEEMYVESSSLYKKSDKGHTCIKGVLNGGLEGLLCESVFPWRTQDIRDVRVISVEESC